MAGEISRVDMHQVVVLRFQPVSVGLQSYAFCYKTPSPAPSLEFFFIVKLVKT